MNFKPVISLLLCIFLIAACTQSQEDQNLIQVVPAEIDARPNILLIVADDMGYTDIGAFGSEIETPNLDDIASAGISMSRFYSSLTCAPSRAMLLSGVDNHRAGLGNMAETVTANQMGLPGYEGYLNTDVVTIAEVLRETGYNTYMAGKWHLGFDYDQSPRARGFDRSFASLYGGGSHFSDMVGPDAHRTDMLYRKDGELIEELPDDFYSTKNYTDSLLENIDSQLDDGKPFFGYLAYTAPHWPLHIPEDELIKQNGNYDEGYDILRKQRFESLKQIGLIPADYEFPDRPDSVPEWSELGPEEQNIFARNMEIYAAMIQYMDSSIGRVIEYLKAQGEYENTLILFLSDNGADSWGMDSAPKPISDYANSFDNRLENRGLEGSFVLYGEQGAHLSSGLLKHYKGTASEGGIRVPAIISWPARINSSISINHPASVLDVLPTFLAAANAEFPSSYNETQDLVQPMGDSILPILSNPELSRDFQFGIEMWRMQAIIVNDWKLIKMPQPFGDDNWKLYNVAEDPTETHDLFSMDADQAQYMLSVWDEYVEENNVVLPPWPINIREPESVPSR